MGNAMVVLRCIDPRMNEGMRKFKSQFPVQFAPDFWEIRIAGGAQALVSGVASEQEAILKSFAIALKYSESCEIYLTIHHDCKAQGGSVAFGNNEHHERVVSTNRLREARKLLLDHFPGIIIHCLYIPICPRRLADEDVSSLIVAGTATA